MHITRCALRSGLIKFGYQRFHQRHTRAIGSAYDQGIAARFGDNRRFDCCVTLTWSGCGNSCA